MTSVHIQIPEPTVQESSSFTATAYFRSGGSASASVTNSKYRVDNLASGKQLKDWTDLTPAVSIEIPITSAMNKIQSNTNRIEKIQLTVASDRGEASATYDRVTWNIENVYGYLGNT